MPVDPQVAQDKDFLAASPDDKIAYLSAHDSDFAKAPRADQLAYIAHLSQSAQPLAKEPSTYEKVTSPINPALDEFSKAHPVLGAGARLMSSLGSTIAGMPGSVYHAFADEPTPEESAEFEGDVQGPKRIGLGIGRMTVLPAEKAIRDYRSGMVTPRAAMSVLPEALGAGTGTAATMEALGRAGPPMMRTLGETPIGRTVRAAGAGGVEALRSSPVLGPIAKGFERGFRRSWTGEEPVEPKPNPVPGVQWEAPNARMHPPAPKNPVPPIRWGQPPAEPRPMAPPPIRYPVRETPQQVAPPPVRWGQPAAEAPAAKSVAAPPIKWAKPPRMSPVGGTPATPAPSGVTFVPEPRPEFEGEIPNYMGSVPREELGRMALGRKPGAGRQLQQLGEPIIYIPPEADIPPPRR